MILHCDGVDGCFNYNSHLYLKKYWGGGNLVSSLEMESVPLFSKNSLLDIIICIFDEVGLSWFSQQNKYHDTFHMVEAR
jgi:hypothetical protein